MKNALVTWPAIVWLSVGMLCAGKWRIAYFYDKDNSSLVINDVQFPSPARGVAAGYLEDKGDSKPVSVTTDDGGAHWTVSKLKQIPVSLFFLNDKLGWMVTPEGIFRTADAGREWREIPKSPKLLMKVYFLNESRGFAIGAHKLAYQTEDGGMTWEPIAAAAEPHTDPEYTVYNNITFVTAKTGLINGFSAPPRVRATPIGAPQETSESVSKDVLVEQVLRVVAALGPEELRTVRSHVDEVAGGDLVAVAVEVVGPRAPGHVQAVLLVVDLHLPELRPHGEGHQAHVEVKRRVI